MKMLNRRWAGLDAHKEEGGEAVPNGVRPLSSPQPKDPVLKRAF
jgi:hypothetical protein